MRKWWMSVEVLAEDKVDPETLGTINERWGSYTMGRHYSVTISINLCLNVTGRIILIQENLNRFKAKWKLHTDELNAKATQLSLSLAHALSLWHLYWSSDGRSPASTILTWSTVVCLWEKAFDSNYTGRTTPGNTDDSRSKYSKLRNKIRKKNFDYILLSGKKNK